MDRFIPTNPQGVSNFQQLFLVSCWHPFKCLLCASNCFYIFKSISEGTAIYGSKIWTIKKFMWLSLIDNKILVIIILLKHQKGLLLILRKSYLSSSPFFFSLYSLLSCFHHSAEFLTIYLIINALRCMMPDTLKLLEN